MSSLSPRLGMLFVFISLISGCATVNGPRPDQDDPYETFNRAMYRFNDRLDKAVAKPVAQFYQRVVPSPINRGISNFFSNLDDIVVTVNDVFQGKFRQAGSDLSRIMFNTTAGVFGLIDVSSAMGLTKHNEDFGQTLGYWGMGSGPYLVLPFLGPSDVRDALGKPVDWYADPLVNVKDRETYWGLVTLRLVDERAELLRATNILEQAALDPYIFTREAFLQRRQSLVYDGNPPRTEDQQEEDIFQDDTDSSAPPSASPPAPSAAKPSEPPAPAVPGQATPAP